MVDLARPTRAGLVVQAVETLRLVAGPPAEDRRTRHRDPGGDLGVGQPVRGQQQDPGPLCLHFGSSLISSIQVTQVAAWLGHSSPTTTLGVYAYCWPNDDESGRKALTVVATVILRDVHPMCTDVSASGSADAATP